MLTGVSKVKYVPAVTVADWLRVYVPAPPTPEPRAVIVVPVVIPVPFTVIPIKIFPEITEDSVNVVLLALPNAVV